MPYANLNTRYIKSGVIILIRNRMGRYPAGSKLNR